MKKSLTALLIGATLLGGCANVGNKTLESQTEDSVNSTIVRGVTTQSQVRSMFGAPYETTFTDGGNTIYKYMYDDTSALTAETVASVVFTMGLIGIKSEGTRKELAVLFDQNNVVKNFNISESAVTAGTGIF